jgi:hypothetical protein
MLPITAGGQKLDADAWRSPQFLIPGGVIWWRWQYFGYPAESILQERMRSHSDLPGSLVTVLHRAAIRACFLVGLRERSQRIRAGAFLLPVVGFAVFALISDETNYGGRFRRRVLPIILMSWIPYPGGSAPTKAQATPDDRNSCGFQPGGVANYSWSQNCHHVVPAKRSAA